MEHDERERRDPSQEDDRSSLDDPGTGDPTAAETPDPDATSTWDTPSTPEPTEAAPTEGAAPAEIESWPSREPAAAEAAAAPIPPAEPAWPTEPPAAGSASEDTWPTEAPEAGDEPILAPDWQSTEPIDTATGAAASDVPDADVTPDASVDWHTDTEPRADTAGEAVEDWRTTDVDATPDAADVVPTPPPSEVEAYPAAPPPADAALAAAAVPAHSVPDGSAGTGESTQCPRCGTENRPGLAFCRNCGQRLVAAGTAATVERPGTPEGTQACPRCGTHNRSGVAFCQNCGANLRGTSESYVPPAVAGEPAPAVVVAERGGAVLGPIVLLIGLVGLVTGYLLPFAYGSGNSLFERAWGSSGYGASFWNGYPQVDAALADQAYFGLAAPVPLLAVLLVALAVAGFVRAAPGMLQSVGLVVALLWSAGLAILFVVVELAANWDGDLVGLLRVLTPAGIIFFLSALIVLIGTLTRFARS